MRASVQNCAVFSVSFSLSSGRGEFQTQVYVILQPNFFPPHHTDPAYQYLLRLLALNWDFLGHFLSALWPMLLLRTSLGCNGFYKIVCLLNTHYVPGSWLIALCVQSQPVLSITLWCTLSWRTLLVASDRIPNPSCANGYISNSFLVRTLSRRNCRCFVFIWLQWENQT